MPRTSGRNAEALQRMLVWGFCIVFFSLMMSIIALTAASDDVTSSFVLKYVLLPIGAGSAILTIYARIAIEKQYRSSKE
jgi:hypothetical protein